MEMKSEAEGVTCASVILSPLEKGPGEWNNERPSIEREDKDERTY
jgi:hypothetical protein